MEIIWNTFIWFLQCSCNFSVAVYLITITLNFIKISQRKQAQSTRARTTDGITLNSYLWARFQMLVYGPAGELCTNTPRNSDHSLNALLLPMSSITIYRILPGQPWLLTLNQSALVPDIRIEWRNGWLWKLGSTFTSTRGRDMWKEATRQALNQTLGLHTEHELWHAAQLGTSHRSCHSANGIDVPRHAITAGQDTHTP